MPLDVIATEGHFAAHLAPVWAALPPKLRGRFIADPEPTRNGANAVLVASYGDHKRARALGYERIARMEHGAGQSYGGEPRSARTPNYAGGKDADDVSLFLVPGSHPAKRWQDAYPRARVEIVGGPRLDDLPHREGHRGAVVGLSFHFNAFVGCPEADSAWRWYRKGLADLAKRFDVIGHAHPRWASRIAPWFSQAGIPFIADFADVCRRADLYAVDNSTTLFEFASTGRPVVVLNGPAYRRDVDHGLRYWDAATVGLQAKPTNVVDVIENALAEDQRVAREAALDLVYGVRTGGASAAAAVVSDWLAA